MRTTSTVVVLAVLAIAACGRSQPGQAPTAAAQFASLRAEGDDAFVNADYERALRAYRSALSHQPDHVDLRYRVGVALSYLGQTDEAATALRWVAQHGGAREETRLARQWLAKHGESLKRPDPGVVAASPATAAAGAADAEGGGGRLRGKAEWTLPPGRSANLQILIVGDEPALQGRRYFARATLPGSYDFGPVAPGRYRLSAQVGPIRLWEVPVTVHDGDVTVLDLTQATSSAPADALTVKPAS